VRKNFGLIKSALFLEATEATQRKIKATLMFILSALVDLGTDALALLFSCVYRRGWTIMNSQILLFCNRATANQCDG
jgi:hypothetical protein